MSILSRIGQITSGLGHAAGDLGGFVKDVGVSVGWAVQDQDVSEISHALISGGISNGAQFLGHIFGPQNSVVGGAIGALPGIVRQPAGDIIHPVLNGDQWLYTHAVSHPLATLLTVGNLSASGIWRGQSGDSNWGTLFDPNAWSKAWDLSNHRSPGQAMAISLDNMFSGDDVLDQGAMNKFAGSDWYKLISGVTDAVTRDIGDPIGLVTGDTGVAAIRGAEEGSLLSRIPVIGGHNVGGLALEESKSASQAALDAMKSQGIDITTDEAKQAISAAGAQAGAAARHWQIGQYLASDRWAKLDGKIADAIESSGGVNEAIGKLRNTVFSRYEAPVRDFLSTAMGQTTGEVEREYAMRVAMGDNTAIHLLDAAGNSAVAEFMRNKFEESNFMHTPSYTPEFHGTQSFRPDVNPTAVADGVKTEMQVGERLNKVADMVNKGLNAQGPVAASLNKIKNSEFYQVHPAMAPVRVFFNKAPMMHINPDDPASVSDLDGMLRQAGFVATDREPIIGKYMSAPDSATKQNIIIDAEKQALQMVGERHGLSADQVTEMMDMSRQYKSAAQDILSHAEVDESGRSLVTLPGMSNSESAQVPVTMSASGTDTFVANMKRLDRFLGRRSIPGVALGSEIMNDAMNIWRPFTLLRPAWPMRVVADHDLLMIAKLKGLSYGMPWLRKEIKSYASFKGAAANYLHDVSEELGLKWGAGVGAGLGGIVAGPLGAVAGAGLGYGFQRLARNIDEFQYPQLMQNGYLANEAFGNGIDQKEYWRATVSNRRDLETGMGRWDPGRLHFPWRDAEGEGRTFLPGMRGYNRQYLRAVRDIQEDPLARLMLAHDHLPEEMQQIDGAQAGLNWLKSPAGQKYIEANPMVANDPEKWVNTIRAHAHSVTLNDSELAGKVAARQPVTIADLNRAATDPETNLVDTARMPDVHREQIAQAVGRSKMTRRINNTIQDLYTALGQLPVDTMVNQRFFAMNYAAEMHRSLAGLADGYRYLTEAEKLDEMEKIFGPAFSEFKRRKLSGVQEFNDMKYRFHGEDVPNEIWMKNDVIPKFTADEGKDLGLRRAKIEGEWTTERIPLNRLVTTQPEITPTGVANAINAHNLSEGDYPIVEKAGSYYILRDGNHRTTYNLLNGDKDMVATVMPTSFMEPGKAEQAIRESYVPGRDVKIPLETAGKLSPDMLNQLEDNARTLALARMRKVMYDYADRSEFADMMRFVMPFFPAWQQTIQRWAGVAMENPDFIRRTAMLLSVPGKMGATWKDPDTGQEYIRFRLPGFARALVNHGMLKGALDDQGYARFQLKGLTPALGAPGFGPWVDVALQPFVHAHPELQDSLKSIFPYGVSDNVMQAFTPPNVTKFQSATESDGRSYRSAYNRILITRLVKMETGELPKLDLNNADNRAQFLNEVQHQAHSFAQFRFVSGLLSPISGIQYDSPYEPLLEIYRNLEKQDPKTAQDKFLDEFGDDYFALTQSFTKLNNGIPPTVAGQQDYEKYKSLIQRFPEMGTLITGEEGGGSPVQFSQAAYNQQLNTPLRPGSNVMQRQELSPEEIIANSDQRLGWIKFTRLMDVIDAIASARGVTNLNVKGAADLRAMKDTFISGVATDHPQWYKDYQMMDENKWTDRIAGMHEIVNDPRLSQRPDIEALKDYLGLRDAVTAILLTRKAKTLSASSNQDLKVMFDATVQAMKDKSLAFSNLYNRWLSNDPVTPVGTGTNIPTIGVTSGY